MRFNFTKADRFVNESLLTLNLSERKIVTFTTTRDIYMRVKTILFIAFFILRPFEYTSGQFFDTGTDPASIKWYQIKTEHFRIVFPYSYRNEAPVSALYLEKAYRSISNTYPISKRNYLTNVIIHNYSTESNGYVAWAPRRMELYPTPQQNSIPQPHSLQLSFHESVHVLQLKSLEKGFSGFMNIIAGQQFTGLVSALIPQWFYEGDAVLFETKLNPGGRGENPSFNKDLKALYSSKPKGYSYDKMLFGSFRDFTPNHYQFGFRMMEYSRSQYGDDLWKNVISYTAGFPFTLNPVNLELNKSADLKKKKLFIETFDTLQTIWEIDRLLDQTYEYKSISPVKSDSYVNYHSPVIVGEDSIVAIKTSFYKPTSIVLITNNGYNEKLISIPGMIYPYFLSSGGGKLAWAESSPDPRWENRDYSVIVVYDLKSNTSRRITGKSRFTAPSLSSNGLFIATCENSVENKNSLVILNAFDGELMRQIPTPDNVFPQRPRWSSGDSLLTVIMLTDNGEGIFNYSIEEDNWVQLIKPAHIDLQDALLRSDTLFFISGITGTDNLFFRTKEGTFYRATRSNFGLSGLDVFGNDLIFTDYTASGNIIASTQIAGEEFRYEGMQAETSPLSGGVPESDRDSDYEGSKLLGDTSAFAISRYRKWNHIFNFHSWMPFYADLDEITSDPLAVSPGITLFSQNLLSSLITSLGYEYVDNNHVFHSGITWKGWYPVVEFNVSYGGDASIIRANHPEANPPEVNPALRTETEIYIPLRFSTGKYSQYLMPAIGHAYVNRYIYMLPTGPFDEGQHFFTGRLYFSNIRRSAYRDIFPAWGQIFDYNYTYSPLDKELYGPISTLRTTFFFPGIFRNNGLRVRLQSEIQKPVRFLHYNKAVFPRGYTNIISEKLKTVSADYVFPILYPDFAAGSLFYIKRIRGSVFYDLSEGWNNSYLETNEFHGGYELFNSFGGELLADFHILRIPFDITGGGRVGYIPDQGRTFIEAVFNVNIYGFSLGSQ